ncbi:MAG: AAA family ATPase [archaeon]|nr:AAA family ATPase [archaeon]
MDRDLYAELLDWKDSTDRKPLIIRGVRQCGKTYLMKHFGQENYRNVAYLKFEGNESLCRLFDGDLEPKRLLTAISIHLDIDIDRDTLLIFDEIQDCERAITSLKSFCESAPEYHIVCAGSLLGLQGKGSFPVGKVSFLDLFPMSFREFVKATNRRLHTYLMGTGTVDDISRDGLKTLYKEYLTIGGMPEAVSKWVETHSMTEVDRILNEISESYKLDFLKHVPGKDIKKVNLIWDSIPSQLATGNRRFFFGHAVKGSRSTDLEDSLQWLIDAGMVYRVPKIEHIGIPLSSYRSDNLFKIYMMDVGILRHKAGVPASSIMEGRVDPLFLGGFTENYVMCELTAYGKTGEGYWASGNSAEVDFLVTTEEGIVPVEVKSGDRYRAASLKEYIDRYSPPEAVVISGKGPEMNGDVHTVPLYSIWTMFH